MKRRIFTGAGVAIVTPMHEDGAVNFEKLGELIDFQIENSTDCIIICGTTGETSALETDEHIRCINYTTERVAGRVPVITGVGSNHTAYATEMSKQAKKAGVDGILCVTPYYNKASQQGLIYHYNAIADTTDLPMVLYNVPSRTGVCIQPETYKELSKHPNIVATKEASGDLSLIAKTIALCGDELSVYSGNDDQIVPILSLGGVGVISVLSNIMPRETHDICSLYLEGKTSESRDLQLSLISLINALFCDVNPIPVKEALNLMGKEVGPYRLPMCKTTPEKIKLIQSELKKHNLIQ